MAPKSRHDKKHRRRADKDQMAFSWLDAVSTAVSSTEAAQAAKARVAVVEGDVHEVTQLAIAAEEARESAAATASARETVMTEQGNGLFRAVRATSAHHQLTVEQLVNDWKATIIEEIRFLEALPEITVVSSSAQATVDARRSSLQARLLAEPFTRSAPTSQNAFTI